MKSIAILLFVLFSVSIRANNPYRTYLISKIPSQLHLFKTESEKAVNAKSTLTIPHFERPKGAVFCRMEDYLIDKTKVWIKIGVK